MLYNPKWETETKPEAKPSRFHRWLARQPADRSYDYLDSCGCGYARYLRSFGVYAVVGPTTWVGLWLGLVPCRGRVPYEIDEALSRRPHTFGAVLQRLNG